MQQWLASGITNAEAAETETSNYNENAVFLMEKAIYCFKQADNYAFAKKAKAQAESIRFRLDLFRGDKSNPARELTLLASERMEGLLEENLLLEASELGRDVAKILSDAYTSSPFFERYILRYLPRGEG
mmetsp:Transcript_20526/g.42887  ORF Transcript_20526/g.42887 Transcript_20526/m.42887 type:complete len:129 (+) Transcript_20526:503-889(+)